MPKLRLQGRRPDGVWHPQPVDTAALEAEVMDLEANQAASAAKAKKYKLAKELKKR
ncbi:hypothetical protein ABBQ32_010285 [Trebouxia sp. C0010 RCD-2024]